MIYLISGSQILKIVKTELQAFYHADIIVPFADYYVNEVSMAGLATYSDAELRSIHDLHTEGYSAPLKWDRETLVGSVLSIMKSFPVCDLTVADLHKRLGHAPIVSAKPILSEAQRLSQLGDANAPVVVSERTASTASAANTKRPKEDSASGRIWAQCDAILAAHSETEVKQLIADWGAGQGLNASTVRTQFGHWRKFNNLR